MAGYTIGGLFKDQARGEAALAELQRAKFSSAQISQVADGDDAPPPTKLNNPVADFFQDHTATGSEFRNNLTSLGMSDKDAQFFEDGVARGGALVTVKADERASDAIAILQRNGAELGSQALHSTSVAAADTPAAPSIDAEDQTLQLRAERLSIDKVRVASGAVRIHKDVIDEHQTLDIPVLREELVIERHPVTDTAAVGAVIGSTEAITVPLSREQVTVAKETFVTEEVDIGKRAVSETAHVSETVRREELVVEGDGNPKVPRI